MGFTNMFQSNPKNNEFHQILEQDIDNLEAGLFSFTIRINNGVVTDYILIRYDKKLGFPQVDRTRDKKS